MPTVIEAYDLSDRDLVERAFNMFSDFEGDHGDRPAMDRLTRARKKKARR